MMLIRTISDVHWEYDSSRIHKTRLASEIVLDYWQPFEMENDSETILVLAGDLWNGTRSIDQIQKFHKRFKKVLIVLGNHDFWCKGVYNTFDKWSYTVTSLIRSYKEELISRDMNNVHLLENEVIEIDDFIFIGSTLWTNMKNYSAGVMRDAEVQMYDFKYIIREYEYFDDNMLSYARYMNVKTWLKLNEYSFEYIKHVVSNNKDKKIVVVTHHAPSKRSIAEKYLKYGDANYYFCSDYDEYIENNDNIVLWIHGHVHSYNNYMIGSTNIVSNPRGFQSEDPELTENKEFKEDFILDIK